MHGMVNHALQGFVTSTYGPEVWARVRHRARLPFDDFEPMLSYPDALTLACFEATYSVLDKHPNLVLEDIGTWLVTDAKLEPLRRLLRFSGTGFLDFLNSLEELGDRGHMAVPDLELPTITVDPLEQAGCYRLSLRWQVPGIAPIMRGCLSAMADDYGALVVLSLDGIEGTVEHLKVQLLDAKFSEGRRFDLTETMQ